MTLFEKNVGYSMVNDLPSVEVEPLATGRCPLFCVLPLASPSSFVAN